VAPVSTGPAPRDLAAGKRGLERGLGGRARTAVLMPDETIITETPPLYSCYGHIGQQVRVPVTGRRAKRVLHRAINVGTGYSGPQKVDHSGHLHLLKLFPFQPP